MCDRLVLDSSERDDRHDALLDADMTADALILMEHQLKHGETGAPRRGGGRGGWNVPTAAGMTREAALLLFNSVRANVSTIYRISFACTQGRIETE